jgi:hypothetical protein
MFLYVPHFSQIYVLCLGDSEGLCVDQLGPWDNPNDPSIEGRPFDLMEFYPVSRMVNSPSRDAVDCIVPV